MSDRETTEAQIRTRNLTAAALKPGCVGCWRLLGEGHADDCWVAGIYRHESAERKNR